MQLSPTQPLTHSPRVGLERRERIDMRKLLDWSKDTLVRKAKAMHKQSKIRHLFSTLHWQVDVQLSWGTSGFIKLSSYLGRLTPSLRMSPQLHVLTMMSHSMEYPLGQWGSAGPAVCPLLTPCAPTACLLVGWEKEESTSAMPKTSQCYQSCFGHKFKTFELLWKTFTLITAINQQSI